jgi:hypothetical protein
MKDHMALVELASQLPLGCLEPEDEQRLEAHLREGCVECEAALRAGAEVLDALVEGQAALSPSPAARARLLALAGAGERRPPRRSGARRLARIAWPLALAASVLAAVGLGLEARELSRALVEARSSAAALDERLAGSDA